MGRKFIFIKFYLIYFFILLINYGVVVGFVVFVIERGDCVGSWIIVCVVVYWFCEGE